MTAFNQLIADLLPRYGAGEAHSIARILFEDVFGTRTPFQKEFSNQEMEHLAALRARLLAGEPVQYVLGDADFFGLKFQVGPAVLIPRQETEGLVAWVLDFLKENFAGEKPALLDAGLGSGCIGLTLKVKWPGLQLFGLEKSPAALAVACSNAQRLLPAGAVFHFLEGDMLHGDAWSQFPPLDVVVSNPPYIPEREIYLMPPHVLDFEPAQALFVPDADALLFYRALADFARQKLRPGGALFLECNEFNAGQVAALLREKGFRAVDLRQDLAGADRMLMGSR